MSKTYDIPAGERFMEEHGEQVLTALRSMVDFWKNETPTPLATDAHRSWQEILDEAQAVVGGPPEVTTYHVENNVTGARASKDFDTEDHTNAICRELNFMAGPGGLYGVYDNKGKRV